jgi:hypothetical protein
MAWFEEYPHKVYASVLLLDNKIENWKVGGHPKRDPGEFSGFWKRDRLSDYSSEYTEFIVNNEDEHRKAFEELAPEWFKQWEHANDYRLAKAY